MFPKSQEYFCQPTSVLVKYSLITKAAGNAHLNSVAIGVNNSTIVGQLISNITVYVAVLLFQSLSDATQRIMKELIINKETNHWCVNRSNNLIMRCECRQGNA